MRLHCGDNQIFHFRDIQIKILKTIIFSRERSRVEVNAWQTFINDKIILYDNGNHSFVQLSEIMLAQKIC